MRRVREQVVSLGRAFLRTLGFKIIRVGRRGRLQKNVFASTNNKTVLISIHNAKEEHLQKYSHTAQAEVWLIAEVFDELGYKVDICGYQALFPYDEIAQYDIVFGYGESVDTILKRRPSDEPRVICYSTAAHLAWNYDKTARRLKESFEQKGIVFRTSYRHPESWHVAPYLYPDALLVTGNEDTVKTFSAYTMAPVYPVTLFGHKLMEIELDQKDFKAASRRFLWMGGRGYVHKGLDLVIDYFKNRPDLELHIAADLEAEPDFYNYYHPVIQANSHINYHGFVKLDSDVFKLLMKQTAFVIVPSCSEGLCGSVVHPMVNGGLIPIVSRESGVEIGDFGIRIEGFTLAHIAEAVETALLSSEVELKQTALKILEGEGQRYTHESFKESIRYALNDIFSDSEKLEGVSISHSEASSLSRQVGVEV